MNCSLSLRILCSLAATCTWATVIQPAARSSATPTPTRLSASFLADHQKSLARDKDLLTLALYSLNNQPMLPETKTPTSAAIAERAYTRVASIRQRLVILEEGQELIADHDPKSPDARLLSPSDKNMFEEATNIYLTHAKAAMILRQEKEGLMNAIKQEIDRWVQEQKDTFSNLDNWIFSGSESKVPAKELLAHKQAEIITTFNTQLASLQNRPNIAPHKDAIQALCPLTEAELFDANLEIVLYLGTAASKLIKEKTTKDGEKPLEIDDIDAANQMLS